MTIKGICDLCRQPCNDGINDRFCMPCMASTVEALLLTDEWALKLYGYRKELGREPFVVGLSRDESDFCCDLAFEKLMNKIGTTGLS